MALLLADAATKSHLTGKPVKSADPSSGYRIVRAGMRRGLSHHELRKRWRSSPMPMAIAFANAMLAVIERKPAKSDSAISNTQFGHGGQRRKADQ